MTMPWRACAYANVRGVRRLPASRYSAKRPLFLNHRPCERNKRRPRTAETACRAKSGPTLVARAACRSDKLGVMLATMKIFELADRWGLPYREGSAASPGPAALEGFLVEYRAFARQRDQALLDHLRATPTRFRSYVPFSPEAYRTALELIWYFDEILILDPVDRWTSPEDLRRNNGLMEAVVESLSLIWQMRDALDAGYIRFAGESILPPVSHAIDEVEVALLLAQTGVREALSSRTRLGLRWQERSDGTKGFFYSVGIGSNFMTGGKNATLPTINGRPAVPLFFGSDLPEASLDDFKRALGEEKASSVIETVHAYEVNRVLRIGANAARLGASLLTHEQHQVAVLSAHNGPDFERYRQLPISGLRLALPFVQSCSGERLLELRESMPLAFLEFRSRLLDALERSVREDPGNFPARAQAIVHREVVPEVARIQQEMESAALRMGILGAGLPAVVATGMLVGSSFGIEPQTLVTAGVALGTSGTLGVVTQAASTLADWWKLRNRGWYFLWRAGAR